MATKSKSGDNKKKNEKEKKGKKGKKGGVKKNIVFKSWIESRRNSRPRRGPWKGVYRDPVKLNNK